MSLNAKRFRPKATKGQKQLKDRHLVVKGQASPGGTRPGLSQMSRRFDLIQRHAFPVYV